MLARGDQKSLTTTVGSRYRASVRATVRDVARLAGVSPKTVSNVVNGRVPVREETRAARPPAPSPSSTTSRTCRRAGLRNGRTGSSRSALPDLSTAYSAEMAQHFVVGGRTPRAGASRSRRPGRDSSRGGRAALAGARAPRRRLVLNPVLLATSAVQRGVSLPPLVLIGEVDQPAVDHVWIDNVAAARAMTDDARSSVGTGGSAVLGVHALRERPSCGAGVTAQALVAAGLALDPSAGDRHRPWDPDSGYRALRGWLTSTSRPTPCSASPTPSRSGPARPRRGRAPRARRRQRGRLRRRAGGRALQPAPDDGDLRQGRLRRGGAVPADPADRRAGRPGRPRPPSTSRWSSAPASALAEPRADPRPGRGEAGCPFTSM